MSQPPKAAARISLPVRSRTRTRRKSHTAQSSPGGPRSLFARNVTDRPLPCPGPRAPDRSPLRWRSGAGAALGPGTCRAQRTPRLRGGLQTERPARGSRWSTPGRGAGTNIKGPTLENVGQRLGHQSRPTIWLQLPSRSWSLPHGEKPRRVAPPQCSPSRAGGAAPPLNLDLFPKPARPTSFQRSLPFAACETSSGSPRPRTRTVPTCRPWRWTRSPHPLVPTAPHSRGAAWWRPPVRGRRRFRRVPVRHGRRRCSFGPDTCPTPEVLIRTSTAWASRPTHGSGCGRSPAPLPFDLPEHGRPTARPQSGCGYTLAAAFASLSA